jgi:hypothetical protein
LFRPGLGYSADTARRYSRWSLFQRSSDVLDILLRRFVALTAFNGSVFWSGSIVRLLKLPINRQWDANLADLDYTF